MPCHDRSMIQISQNAKANDLIKMNPEDTHLVLPKEVIEESKVEVEEPKEISKIVF